MGEEISIGVTSIHSVSECPRCFWISEKIGSVPTIFPGLPSQMDSVIKNHVREAPELPEWFPVEGELVEVSQLEAVEPESGILVRGRLDALVKTGGGYYIVDYKTGRAKEEIPDYYQTQLDGYAFLLEENNYTPVTGAALIYFTPRKEKIIDEKIPFKITPVPGNVDAARILEPLSQAKKILEMSSPPPPSDDCDMCKWRERVRETLFE